LRYDNIASLKKYPVPFLTYLAINTGSSTSISNTYILFLTKLQKKYIPEKGFAPIEKRYYKNFEALIFKLSLQNSEALS